MKNDAGLLFETDHRNDHEHPNDQQKQTKYKIQNFHYYSHTIIGHSNTGVHFLNLQGSHGTSYQKGWELFLHWRTHKVPFWHQQLFGNKPSSMLILIAIVLLGVCLLGGGTMVYCRHGWERGLPFLSIRQLYDDLAELDRRTTQRYKDWPMSLPQSGSRK